jgi:Fe-S oxidoreductase
MDEFLIRSQAFQALGSRSAGTSLPKIKFHPHCHQRAEGLSDDGLPTGVEATLAALCACGYEVELLDTGCCGMAGTFGYEAEHYDLSLKVAELKLFPALRAAGAGTGAWIISASGAACRMQMAQGLGMPSTHPIELLRDALVVRK